MPKAYPSELRWRAVYKVVYDGLSFSEAADDLSAGPLQVTTRWVSEMYALFEETGDVESVQGARTAPPANRAMSAADSLRLIHQLLDHPEMMLVEHHALFEASSSTTLHISTFCRAVKALGFTRKRVRSGRVGLARAGARRVGKACRQRARHALTRAACRVCARCSCSSMLAAGTSSRLPSSCA